MFLVMVRQQVSEDTNSYILVKIKTSRRLIISARRSEFKGSTAHNNKVLYFLKLLTVDLECIHHKEIVSMRGDACIN